MRGHVIGNGPSWVNFKKIDSTDFVVGCNVTQCKEANVTTMSDITLGRQIMHDKNHGRWNRWIPPIIASDYLVKWMEEPSYIEGTFEVYSTYTRPAEFKGGEMSSAHYALIWLIDHGYDEIHVWGIDSYVTKDLSSHTDEIKKKSGLKRNQSSSAKAAERWKGHWHRIIDENPSVEVILHLP